MVAAIDEGHVTNGGVAVRATHLGRDAWPGRAGDAFADRMNAIARYVVSRTLSTEDASLRWNNTTLIDDDDAIGAIRELRDRGWRRGHPGDGQLVARPPARLEQPGDEYRLMLEPILLGGGKTIFPSDGRARPLRLVSVTQAKTGVLICAYRPAAD